MTSDSRTQSACMLSGMSQELVTLINSNRCSFTKLWKIDIDQNYYSLYKEDNANV